MGQRQVPRIGFANLLFPQSTHDDISGPATFMLRTIIVGTTCAVSHKSSLTKDRGQLNPSNLQAFCGMTGAMFGSFLFGTASLPFLAASSLGFVLGAHRWYYASLEKALLSLDAYPELLRLHLDINYPEERFRKMNIKAFRSERFRRDWRWKSMLVSSWLTAQPAIDNIAANEEEALIAEYAESSKGAERSP